MTITEIHQSTLFIVTETPALLRPLVEYLQGRGLSARMTSYNDHVVEAVAAHRPDIILLDVSEAGANGIDICLRLKTNKETQDVPVIFLNMLTATDDKVRGFDAGGVDYITKPFEEAEVLARISAHLRIRHLQTTLQQNNARLQQEIQQRQQIEEALRESEERFRVLADATFEGIIVHDKGFILDVNHELEKMFDYARAELIGRNALDLMMADLRDGILSNIRTDYENLTEAEGRRKDGAVFPVELQAKAMPHHGKSVRVTAIRDVTWRKQAEDALLESERYIRNIIDSSLDMIITVDVARRIVEFNAAAQKGFGYCLDEIVGQPVEMLYARQDESNLVHRMMLQEGQVIREVLNRRKNGEEFPCLLSASTMRDARGNLVGHMGISRDITEQKQAQAELLATHHELKEKNQQLRELNASKDKFFSIISHDLKNPFSVLLGFAELLSMNVERYDRQRIQSLANRMHTSAEKLYALLENLLAWSKIQRGLMECVPETIDVSLIVEENVDLFMPNAEKKRITLENRVTPGNMVHADPSMVNTVLRNLVSNALKFTSAGGSVTISAHRRDDRLLEIAVTDTGVGIPAHVLPRLLRIDTQYTHVGTAGEEGTGLGLILCKELVEQNGGTIWIESEADAGATFRFTLPR